MQCFEDFRYDSGYAKEWLAPVEHLLHYCINLKQGGLVTKSIRGQLVGIAFYSRSSGHHWWLPCSEDVRGLSKGSWCMGRWSAAHFTNMATEAMEWDLWFGVWGLVFSHGHFGCIFGALQVSKLIAHSRDDAKGQALFAQDMQLADDKAILTIQRSKTVLALNWELSPMRSCALFWVWQNVWN